ncbi:beta-glucosidase [Derxia gummosa]|uniref:Beta-glucosidase n=1 Tax=Derxia gummosa DSM 723 TaxID=1121388 RepID=A0A8B6X8E0_9BURK|nr:beta-glucosidase [Derxia gummosa]
MSIPFRLRPPPRRGLIAAALTLFAATAVTGSRAVGGAGNGVGYGVGKGAGSRAGDAAARPWLDAHLPPDERARLLEAELTLDERIALVHGPMALPFAGKPVPKGALGSAGYVPGVPRLGIPALQETDASLGVANPADVRPGDGATALPSSLALAASFDPQLAFDSGAMIGREARAKGFNVLLAGGANLARDPRNGRNFEYLGEDPLLAGTLAGESIRGIQSQRVISTLKHFSLNAQETNRQAVDACIDEAAHRESDLLAFQLAVERGRPGSVMCGYNLVNGEHACGNAHLLNRVLKGDWGYPGWVMSDWGAVHAVRDALAGLDQESGEQLDAQVFFGAPLKAAVEAGEVPRERLSDMVRRVLRSMFAVGLFDAAPMATNAGGAASSAPATVGAAPACDREPIDRAAHAAVARKVAAEGMVLLANRDGLLPLGAGTKRIAVIGAHADVGVPSGGGSSQVMPWGGPAAVVPVGQGGSWMQAWSKVVWHPSAPLAALRERLPGARIEFDNGRYPSRAAALAREADVAVVFVEQWMIEALDAPDLSLPEGQDALVAEVARANPNTVVVLQTGGPVLMPWLGGVKAVLAAWYAGGEGGAAIADVLTGAVNPSGRLPVSFPASLDQTPRGPLPLREGAPGERFAVEYREGSDVGYRWHAARGNKPLFAFGHGLSYTRFVHERLAARGGATVAVELDVVNTGARAGAEVVQLYAEPASGRPGRRLIGFTRVELTSGERRRVSIEADPRLLADFDAAANGWHLRGGERRVLVARDALADGLAAVVRLEERRLPAGGR